MRKSKELLFIRYISLFILAFQLMVISENRGIITLVFILLFIINNQLRIFYFEKQWQRILSILMEIAIIPLAQMNFGGSIIFYLIGVSIDTFTLGNSFMKYFYEVIILVFSFLPILSETKEESFVYFSLMGILFILLSYISRLHNTKKQAQNLYDKLRISEGKLIEVNKELEGYLQSIEEITLLKERNRISRDIHDSVGHALSTAMIQLSAMEAVADKEGSALKPMAGNLRAFMNKSFQEVKVAVRELKPDEYDNYQGLLRLQETCKTFEKLSGVRVKTIVSKGEWNLSSKQISHLYKINQEVLSNSLRHGKAKEVKVIMNFTEDEFVMSFNDNGVGTDKIEESGLGLKSIRERAEELGAVLDMKSGVGKGFFIKLIVPRETEA
ncbi:MAG: sensor histidine kinase [Clostridium sp.]|uniref:sensor histidine kinase n=1 Tax=Clostridium sp. TaxID=1506 RepID=UPI003060F2EA